MEVGHSRLLKFVLPNNSTEMSDPQELRVEYISQPPKVQSLVPAQQTLRISDDASSSGDQSDNAKNDDSTFVPVFKTTKEEAVFTKGDLKLQKVSVTEDISESQNKDLSPMYSEVQSETINTPLPLRSSSTDDIKIDEKETKKSKSRIPMLRQVAEKFKQDRKQEREMQPRRSSIPKLKRTTGSSISDIKNVPTDDTNKFNEQDKINVQTNIHDNEIDNIPPEEEFDKMYDEIIHDNSVPLLDTNLVENLEDAEKLEHSFEEIIHDYEANEIQPIDVTEIKSRTPFVKQKSLPEGKFSSKLERQSSLKNTPIDNNSSDIKYERKLSKLEEIKKKFNRNSKYQNRKEKEDIVILQPKNMHEVCTFDDPSTETTNDLESVPSNVQNNHSIEKETIKIVTPILREKSSNEDKFEILNNETIKVTNKEYVDQEKYNKTLKSTRTIIEKSGLIENTPSFDKNNVCNTESELSRNDVGCTEIKERDEKNKKQDPITPIPTSRGKVSQLAHLFVTKGQFPTQSNKKETFNELPNKNNIVSKIAVLNKSKDVASNKIKYKTIPDVSSSTANKTGVNQTTSIVTNKLKNISMENPTGDNSTCNIPKNLIPQEEDGQTIENSVSYVDQVLDRDDDVTKTFQLATQYSIEKPTEFETALIKEPQGTLKVNVNSIVNVNTPPNTPQSNEYEPYKDSAHLAGEPKILNIDNTCQLNNKQTITTVYKTKETIKSIESGCTVPHSSNESKQKVNIRKIDLVSKPKLSAKDVYNKIEYDRNQSIDLESPNADNICRALLFEKANSKIDTEDKIEGNNYLVQGNVHQIINKIDSIDEKSKYPNKKESIVEIPVKKSVSSKIAMFERQSSTPLENKPIFKPQYNTKPIIIEEVLKAQPPRKSESYRNITHNETSKVKAEIYLDSDISGNEKITHVKNSIVYDNKEYVATVAEIQDLSVDNAQGNILSGDFDKVESNATNLYEKLTTDKINNTDNSVEVIHNAEGKYIINETKSTIIDPTKDFSNDKRPLPEHKKEVLVSRIKERLKRVKSVTEDSNLKKSKSVAELDIGDAVKGKVHQMIVRMNSVEKIELENKGNCINIKERPRKKSVSEKIALFERKLAPVEIEVTTQFNTYENVTLPSVKTKTTTTKAVAEKETESTPGTTPSVDYQNRIEELMKASVEYGRLENMTYVKLNNGQKMPVLALGTALLDANLLPYVIGAAIDMGYRAIDTAFIYGNEHLIGPAIQAKIEDGTVQREDLFIVGKLWSTFHRRDLVESACRASLKALGLEYFDLYLVHNPMSLKEGGLPIPMIANVIQYSEFDYLDAWYGMEEVYQKGLAKSIGVSNFNSEQIAKVVNKGKVKPVVNQVECHPYLNQLRLEQALNDHDIRLMCYGALGSKGTPAAYKAHQDSVIDDPLVKVMAAGLNMTAAQLLIRYQIECGHAVVTKCTTADHLWDVLQALNLSLGSAEVEALHALNKNKRTFTFKGMGDTHRNYPFKIPY